MVFWCHREPVVILSEAKDLLLVILSEAKDLLFDLSNRLSCFVAHSPFFFC
jgi:hypothetical protein